MQVDETAERVGRNEALYRVVNEKIQALGEAFGLVTESMTIVCECGDIACAEQIVLPIPEYERVRADPTHFAIRPGHDVAGVEAVIERHDPEYHVVRKRPGGPAELARETDPRS